MFTMTKPESSSVESTDRRRHRRPWLSHVVLILCCIATVAPLLWVLRTAVSTPASVFDAGFNPFPTDPTWQNFPSAFSLAPIGRWFLNSAGIALAITIGKLCLTILAAYGFAFFHFPAKNLILSLAVGTMIVPNIVTLVPNFVTIADLGWVNTPQGVIVPSLAFCGFGIFLLRQAMLQIPAELLRAAEVDGAGAWTVLWKVVLPITKPAVAVIAIMYFVWAWNSYLWPLTVLTDNETRTLPIGLQFMASDLEGSQLWGELMATTLLTIVPPVLLYIAAQRAIISTFARSGLHG